MATISCVTIGVVAGHLVVAASGLVAASTETAVVGPDVASPTERTLAFDLNSGAWVGRVTNFSPKYMASAQVPGEIDALLAVTTEDKGYVLDGSPMFTGAQVSSGFLRSVNLVLVAGPRDGNINSPGIVSPNLKAWSASNLAGAQGIEGEAKMVALTVHSNVLDTEFPSSGLTVSVVHGGGIAEPQTQTKVLDAITADTVDRVDRFTRRVNRTGRLHQIRVEITPTATNNKRTDIPEFVTTFRDSRRRT